MAGTTWGTLLPAAYGTNHLGSVRAMDTALMVVATAIGPGITGLAIDWGVTVPDQALVMAIWCVGLSLAMTPNMRQFVRLIGIRERRGWPFCGAAPSLQAGKRPPPSVLHVTQPPAFWAVPETNCCKMTNRRIDPPES
jgi:hypothetical protein